MNVHIVPMQASWLSEGLIANPMSVYPAFHGKRSSWFGPMTSAIIEIQDDAGHMGCGVAGGGKGKLAAPIINEQFRGLPLGQNPLNIEQGRRFLFR